MEIDLKINRLPISVGMSFNEDTLRSVGIKKMGFFNKAFLPVAKVPGDIVYWVQNPSISCFEDRVLTSAVLDMSMGADNMNGTSAFFFFNGGRIRHIIVQVIRSYIASTEFANNFRKVASEVLGEAKQENPTPISSTFMGMSGVENFMLEYKWKDEKETVVSELARSGNNAYVHWKTR